MTPEEGRMFLRFETCPALLARQLLATLPLWLARRILLDWVVQWLVLEDKQ